MGKDVNDVSSGDARPRTRARHVARGVGLVRHLQPPTTDYQVRGIPTVIKDSEVEAIWGAPNKMWRKDSLVKFLQDHRLFLDLVSWAA